MDTKNSPSSSSSPVPSGEFNTLALSGRDSLISEIYRPMEEVEVPSLCVRWVLRVSLTLLWVSGFMTHNPPEDQQGIPQETSDGPLPPLGLLGNVVVVLLLGHT